MGKLSLSPFSSFVRHARRAWRSLQEPTSCGGEPEQEEAEAKLHVGNEVAATRLAFRLMLLHI